MGNETRMPLQPSSHVGLLVSSVVVHHQMQGLGARKFLVQTPQKAQEFLVAMTQYGLGQGGPWLLVLYPLQEQASIEFWPASE